jgi:hypothetical protein
MTERDFRRTTRLAVALCAAIVLSAVAAGTAVAATTIYDNIPSTIPGNVVSEGFECCSISQFGGQVSFIHGKWKNPKVTVLMSSWACQQGTWTHENCVTQKGAKFQWPVTVSIYRVGPDNAPGAEIGAASKAVKIPYRPSTSPICNETTEYQGGWYDKKEETCHHGIAAKITIPLKIVELPEKAIVTVAYNTSDYGAEPQRPKSCDGEEAGCPYDSLNVGAEDALPESSYPLPDDAYISGTWEPEYCGSGTPLATFGLSGSAGNPCWKGYQPAIEVQASAG